jgi:acyl-CoA synthetase (AMP-forming)/AMP-acid ligase II
MQTMDVASTAEASFLPDATRTYLSLFGARVRETPSDVLFHVVEVVGRELSERAFSYTEIDQRVQIAARELAQQGAAAGERVLLSLSRLDHFVVYFLATQALGAIPVPLPAAAEYEMPQALRERVRSVASDCLPRVLVADSAAALDSVRKDLAAGTALLEASDTGGASARAAPTEPLAGFDYERTFSEIAFIQYTSGSTGEPKGVVVDHGNLVANLRGSAHAARFGPRDVSFSWLPMYHDMGLIGGLLQGTYLGLPTYVMLPRFFVRRPEAWLKAVTRYGVTYTVAPNFAYNMAARRLPDSALAGLDLSQLRLAFNGAEPIDRDTLEAFITRFEPYGFKRSSFFPVYGLAEHTLAAAFPEPGAGATYDVVDRRQLTEARRAVASSSSTAEESLTFVSSGRAMADHQIRILDLERDEALPERCVGEVALSGPSLSRGYHGKSAHGAELRTGDLGYFAGGQLYVVDRLKDLIIVGGRNVVPSDVEREVAKVSGTWPGAIIAFGVRSPHGTEDLVVVAGIDRRARPNLDALKESIRKRVFETLNVPVTDVRLVMPGNVPKTSSGKVQRGACRQLYETRTLKVVEAAEAAS